MQCRACSTTPRSQIGRAPPKAGRKCGEMEGGGCPQGARRLRPVALHQHLQSHGPHAWPPLCPCPGPPAAARLPVVPPTLQPHALDVIMHMLRMLAAQLFARLPQLRCASAFASVSDAWALCPPMFTTQAVRMSELLRSDRSGASLTSARGVLSMHDRLGFAPSDFLTESRIQTSCASGSDARDAFRCAHCMWLLSPAASQGAPSQCRSATSHASQQKPIPRRPPRELCTTKPDFFRI
jgi:hypothetical protein